MIVPVAGAIAALVAIILGGDLRRLADLRLRAPAAIAAVVIVQAYAIEAMGGTAAAMVHMGTYIAAGWWVWLNRHVPGLPVLALGTACNGIVIAVNGGVMPADPHAVEAAGLAVGNGFDNSAPTVDAALWWLGDIFHIPQGWPLANVFSIGDVILVAGVFIVLRRGMTDPDHRRAGGMVGIASAATGLPRRIETLWVAVMVAAVALVAALAILADGPSLPTRETAGLLLLAGLANAAPVHRGVTTHTATSSLLLVGILAAPGALWFAAVTMLAGDLIQRGTDRKLRGTPRLVAVKVLLSISAQISVAAAVLATMTALVGDDLTDPVVIVALMVACVAFDMLEGAVIATVASAAEGRFASLGDIGTGALVPTLVVAATTPIVVLLAGGGPAEIISAAVVLAAWSVTATRFADAMSAAAVDHVSGASSRPVFLADAAVRPPARIVAIRIVDFIATEQALGTAAVNAIAVQAAHRIDQVAHGHVIGHVSRDTFAVAFVGELIDVEDLLEAVEGTYRTRRVPVPVAAIAAVADDEPGTDVAELLIRAESALVHGHGKIRHHSPQMPRGTADDLTMAAQLRKALKSGEIVPWYQMIMAADERSVVVGAEALARWEHPVHGTLPPARWMDKLIRMGLDGELARIVIERVCADIARWERDNDALVRVNVNVTANDIGSGALADTVADACRRHGVHPSMLTVEITEQIAMADPELTMATIDRLHEIGCGVAIDDFGVGHSSFARLAAFRFDELKIDRSMLTDVQGDARTVSVLSALVDLGHMLGMRVTAEGIETVADADLATGLGVDKLQGYGFGRPADAIQFIREACMHGEVMPASAPDTAAAILPGDAA